MSNESFRDALNREHDLITLALGHHVRLNGGNLATPTVEDCIRKLEALEDLSKKFWGTDELVGIPNDD